RRGALLCHSGGPRSACHGESRDYDGYRHDRAERADRPQAGGRAAIPGSDQGRRHSGNTSRGFCTMNTAGTKARVLSGIELSEIMRAEIAEQAAAFKQQTGVTPGLAVVLVGNDPASEVYVRMKGKAADKAGFYSQQITLPEETTEAHLLGIIDGLNADPRIHGILVQLPLPKHINKERILSAISV